MLKAGFCTQCSRQVWRSVPDPLTGIPIILWPDPATRYLTYELGTTLVNSVCVCSCYDGQPGAAILPNAKAQLAQSLAQAADRPTSYVLKDLETAVLVGAQWAKQRYAYWFTEAYGDWLVAWLRDYAKLSAEAIAAMMARWRVDCQAPVMHEEIGRAHV